MFITYAIRIAASFLILVGIIWGTQGAFIFLSVDNPKEIAEIQAGYISKIPEQAYEEVRKALLMVSAKNEYEEQNTKSTSANWEKYNFTFPMMQKN